jgi:hypothetical protein
MQFSPPSLHFIPLRSQYSPQLPVLKHPQSSFPLNIRDQVQAPPIIYLTAHYLLFQYLCFRWDCAVAGAEYRGIASSGLRAYVFPSKYRDPPFYNIRETGWPTKKVEVGHKDSKVFVSDDVCITGTVQCIGIVVSYSEFRSVQIASE